MSTIAARLLHGREGVERAARAGLAGKGVLYAVLGVLAGQVALRGGGDQASQSGAIAAVAAQPFGTVLLALLALGLTGYALWRLAQVAIGPVTRSRLPGSLLRVTFLVRALGYGALAALAWRTVVTGSGGGGGGQERRWTREILEPPWPSSPRHRSGRRCCSSWPSGWSCTGASALVRPGPRGHLTPIRSR